MRTRTKASRWRGAVLGLAVLVGAGMGTGLGVAGAEAATVTYTATQTFAPPPAVAYGGTAGGDGWAVALTATSVYNIYHHLESTIVACHHQSDAASCWGPKTVTDSSGGGFSTASHTGLWINKTTGRLYLYGTRHADLTGGVICFDTVAADAGTNPFCGFTALTAAGESPEHQQAGVGGGPGQTMSAISEPVGVGGRWYAFNYVPGSPAAAGAGSSGGSGGATGRNALLCFDQTTLASCSGQPYAVDLGVGPISDTFYPVPPVAGVAGRVLVPATVTAGARLACFDPATGVACTGSWPIAVTAPYIGVDGPAFPLLAATGAATGFCLPTQVTPCFGITGAPLPTPVGLAAALPSSTRWNGNSVTVGTRVYLPVGRRANSAGTITIPDEVACYDAATAAGCAGFPKVLSGLTEVYTVNEDPYRPTCLWVNADTGNGAQIQNFDAFTGAACIGASRVVGADVVVPSVICRPTAFTTLQVSSPARNAYAKGNVTVLDATGAALPGGTGLTLDATGSVSLAGLTLPATGLPQFLIKLDGADATLSLTVKVSWTATDDPICLKPGTTSNTPSGGGGQGHRHHGNGSGTATGGHRGHGTGGHGTGGHGSGAASGSGTAHHTGHPGPGADSAEGHHHQGLGSAVRPPCVAGYQKKINVPGW
jgi:hypothetical protein